MNLFCCTFASVFNHWNILFSITNVAALKLPTIAPWLEIFQYLTHVLYAFQAYVICCLCLIYCRFQSSMGINILWQKKFMILNRFTDNGCVQPIKEVIFCIDTMLTSSVISWWQVRTLLVLQFQNSNVFEFEDGDLVFHLDKMIKELVHVLCSTTFVSKIHERNIVSKCNIMVPKTKEFRTCSIMNEFSNPKLKDTKHSTWLEATARTHDGHVMIHFK